MRLWQFGWQTLRISVQQDPPRFIESVMLILAIAMGTIWLLTQEPTCLVLGVGYTVGSATSIWVRELMSPFPDRRVFHASIVLLMTLFLFGLSLV